MELIATSRFQRALKRATEAESFTRTDRAQSFLESVPNRRLNKPFDVDALTAVLISPGDHDALP
jgi:F0F1-type ATP synthase gamma subunit